MGLVKLYIRVLSLLRSNARLAWTLTIANLALAGAHFAEPILLGKVIDTLSSSATNYHWLLQLLMAWAAFGIFNIFCGTLVALYADRLSHTRRHGVLSEYYEHVLGLPQSFHRDVHSGRLMKVMLQGTDSLWGLWIGFFRDHLQSFASFFIMLPLTLFMNWRLAILLTVLCAVFSIVTSYVMRKTENLQKRVEDSYSELAERASDTLGNIPLVHSFVRIEAEVRGLRSVIDRLLAAQIPVLSWWAVVSVLTRGSTTLTVLCIISIGAWLHSKGQASIGEIVTFMSFATMLIDRLQNTVNFVNRIFLEAPRLREFFSVLDTHPAIKDAPDAVELRAVNGKVAFNHVTFRYSETRTAIDDLTFNVRPGEVTALVGSTGAGKSTAMSLLYRAFDPQQGEIKVDDIDIRQIRLASLRRNIGVVFQEGMLFNRTIADNLRIGKPDATLDELRDAAQRAQALEFIERTPGQFEARVGERGRSLSGGERQRLSIARALLKNPPILILDEATSALDTRTETLLQDALREVMKGRTTFVIAHRLSTIRDADRVLVFSNGKVVEAGTFDELVAQNGVLAELARSQSLTAQISDEKALPAS
ncbi:MAG: glucan ABC transporter ATP-binding protein/ permease [Pseudomonadota bacterium]